MNKLTTLTLYCNIPTPMMLVLLIQLTNLIAITTVLLILYPIYLIIQKKITNKSFPKEHVKIIKIFIPLSLLYFLITFFPFPNAPFYTNNHYFTGYLLLSLFFWIFTFLMKKINNQALFRTMLAFSMIILLASVTVTIAKLIPHPLSTIDCQKPSLF